VDGGLVCCACASLKGQIKTKTVVVINGRSLAKADRWLLFMVASTLHSRCRVSLWHNLFPEGVALEFERTVQARVGMLKCCICVAFLPDEASEALAKDVLLLKGSAFQQEEEAEKC
jgi:hypothetical protein